MKWSLLILYGVIAGLILLAVCYFMNWLGVKPLIDGLIAYVAGTGVFAKASEYVANNPIAVAGIAVPTIGTVIGVIRYKMEAKLNKQLTEAVTNLEAENTTVSSTAKSAELKIEELQSKLKLYESDSSLSEAQNLVTSQTKTITQLEAQVKQLQSAPAQLAENLWIKSGGQTLEAGGQLYRVIEKASVVVK